VPTARTETFGADYYDRFYGRGSVHNAEQIDKLATAVHSLLGWWGLDVRSVLDVGAGPGFWRDWYRENHPTVKVLSTDVSEFACATYGHKRADIATWSPPRKFDLVICHSVLQYPDNTATRAAINNLAAGARHFMYLEIPTSSDFDDIVDTDVTDMSVHRRSGTWYRRELDRHFRQVGGGLWLSRSSNVLMYELEMPANDRR
jgi:SAM-dependent methyltransferase